MRMRKKKTSQITSRRVITLQNSKSPISEQYRTLRTNLKFSSVESIKSIIVTSPGQGEGKSTTAANLAVALSQEGNKVLLIDADLRKPTVHYSFKVSNLNGLTSVLTKQATLEEAIQNTNELNLDILTSGTTPPNPSELLNSDNMEVILVDSKEKYDYVILDTPPIIPVSDATILANKADGVLLVIANGITEKNIALKAKDQLLHAKANILGAVFNGSDEVNSYAYYYGDNNG